jgi:hypothetical protein
MVGEVVSCLAEKERYKRRIVYAMIVQGICPAGNMIGRAGARHLASDDWLNSAKIEEQNRTRDALMGYMLSASRVKFSMATFRTS